MKLVLGTAQLSRNYGVVNSRHRETHDSAERLIGEAEAAGFYGLDTAPLYGEAESDIGKAKCSLPIFTKLDPFKSIENSIQTSRQRLNRSFLDGVYLHEEYVASRRQMEILKRLQDRKPEDVGFIGVSIYTIEEFHLANANPDVNVLQLPHNILDRRFDSDFLSRNLDPSKRVFARSIFLQGVLLRTASQLPEPVAHLKNYKILLENLGKKNGQDDLDLALGYVLLNHELDAIIVGTSSVAELREVSARTGQLMASNPSVALELEMVPTWDAVDPRRWSER